MIGLGFLDRCESEMTALADREGYQSSTTQDKNCTAALFQGVHMALGIFTVHAGDFRKGKDHQFLRGNLIMKKPKGFFREKISVDQVETVDVASEESVKRLGGTIGWGVAGGLLLGPVGLLAGLLAGGYLADRRAAMAFFPSDRERRGRSRSGTQGIRRAAQQR